VQLAEKLRGFTESTAESIEHANDVLVADRFAGDVAATIAAVERGDEQAQLAILRWTSCDSKFYDETTKWWSRGSVQDNIDMILWMGLGLVSIYLTDEKNRGPERDLSKKTALEQL
jgi:hypothetical protein